MLPLSSDTALDCGFGRTATCSPLDGGTLVPLAAAWACAEAAAALSRLTTVTTSQLIDRRQPVEGRDVVGDLGRAERAAESGGDQLDQGADEVVRELPPAITTATATTIAAIATPTRTAVAVRKR